MISLALYILLLLVTCFFYSFAPLTITATGFLVLLWSVLGISRLLWVFEGIFFTKRASPQKVDRQNLPSRLLLSLSKSRTGKYAHLAGRAFDWKTIILVILGLVYMGWIIYVGLNPSVLPAYRELALKMEAFFKQNFEIGHATVHFQTFQRVLGHLAGVTIIAMAFILALTFAYSRKQGNTVLGIALLVLGTSVFFAVAEGGIKEEFLPLSDNIWTGYGTGGAKILQRMELLPQGEFSAHELRYYELGMGGIMFLHLTGIFLGLTFISALFRGRPYMYYALTGLVILACLVLSDRYITVSPTLHIIWLSGWVCLAVTTVRCSSLARRTYRLHQK